MPVHLRYHPQLALTELAVRNPLFPKEGKCLFSGVVTGEKKLNILHGNRVGGSATLPTHSTFQSPNDLRTQLGSNFRYWLAFQVEYHLPL